ncbi:three-Cys-motif partner protein TcmP [Sphingobacterium siyangense]|uniref:three-Cys-motif partner protein TcmP n=1 Tax=Sphingobacterium siyangense TaxID=459529 RepID=UPI003DA53C01
MNSFGGNWTYQKIKIIENYAKAYLEIMKGRPYWKLLYFDGFAGSGEIRIDGAIDSKVIEGAAKKIVALKEPKMFDICYFVELDKSKAKNLQDSLYQIRKAGIFVVEDDCNRKLHDMAEFLKSEKGKNHKVLAFIDPCGMEVNWESLACLKGLPVDMWLLIPTGIGVNRLLRRDNHISEAWWQKLERFYGLSKELLNDTFYKTETILTLFGEEDIVFKDPKALKSIEKIYIDRLNEIFKYVSKPYVLKNKNQSVMFHFVLTSNSEVAIKIANDIIKKMAS